MNHCFAIGLVGDCWWVGQRWEFNFKVQTEQKIHGTTGNTTGLRCRLKHTVYGIMLRVAFELYIQHIINSKADRRALQKKIVQVLVLGSKRKKIVLTPFEDRIFLQEDSIHLLLLCVRETSAVSSLARKNKAHGVHDMMLSRASIFPLF